MSKYDILSRGELARAARRDYPGLSARSQATQAVMGMAPDFAKLLLIEYVEGDIEKLRRAEVKPVERAAFHRTDITAKAAQEERRAALAQIVAELSIPLGELESLLTKSFWVDSTEVLYADSTPVHHRRYADREEGKVAGLLDTIALHRELADFTEARGARTLGEAVHAWAQ